MLKWALGMKYFDFWRAGGAAGAINAHIDDIAGCCEPDIMLKTRKVSEIQGASFVRVRIELAEEGNFFSSSDSGGHYQELGTIPTSPDSWASRKNRCPQGKLSSVGVCWASRAGWPLCFNQAFAPGLLGLRRESTPYEDPMCIESTNWSGQ